MLDVVVLLSRPVSTALLFEGVVRGSPVSGALPPVEELLRSALGAALIAPLYVGAVLCSALGALWSPSEKWLRVGFL